MLGCVFVFLFLAESGCLSGLPACLPCCAVYSALSSWPEFASARRRTRASRQREREGEKFFALNELERVFVSCLLVPVVGRHFVAFVWVTLNWFLKRPKTTIAPGPVSPAETAKTINIIAIITWIIFYKHDNSAKLITN